MFKRILGLDARVWSAGAFNVFAWGFQLVETIRTETAPAIVFLLMAIYIQLTFAQAGWRTKARGQFWGMAIGASISSAVLILKFAR